MGKYNIEMIAKENTLHDWIREVQLEHTMKGLQI